MASTSRQSRMKAGLFKRTEVDQEQTDEAPTPLPAPELVVAPSPTPAAAAPNLALTAEGEVPKIGKMLNCGVNLAESEVAMVDAVKTERNVARNAVLRHAIRFWLREYHSGNERAQIRIKTIPEKLRVEF